MSGEGEGGAQGPGQSAQFITVKTGDGFSFRLDGQIQTGRLLAPPTPGWDQTFQESAEQIRAAAGQLPLRVPPYTLVSTPHPAQPTPLSWDFMLSTYGKDAIRSYDPRPQFGMDTFVRAWSPDWRPGVYRNGRNGRYLWVRAGTSAQNWERGRWSPCFFTETLEDWTWLAETPTHVADLG